MQTIEIICGEGFDERTVDFCGPIEDLLEMIGAVSWIVIACDLFLNPDP